MAVSSFLGRRFWYIPVLLLISLLVSFLCFSSAKWTYYAKNATIEGYVFIDRRLDAEAIGEVRTKTVDRPDLFSKILTDWTNKHPHDSATLSLGTTGIVARTNNYGYFRIKSWWPSARDKAVTLSAKGIKTRFGLDLEDRLSNLLFIDVKDNGHAEVYCLREDLLKREASNAVILVHGFGINVGAFTLSKDRNSWGPAYNLFVTDPELSEYDFFLLDHRDDQSLVTSSFELACFLRLTRHAYGETDRIVVLGHSAGGLITRHYMVSRFYRPGTVDRFLMLATPNEGSVAGLFYFDPMRMSDNDTNGESRASQEILPDSDFLNCLNNRSETPIECKRILQIDKGLQDYRGLNPAVPCAILAGEVKHSLVSNIEDAGKKVGFFLKDWFGQDAEDWVKNVMDRINRDISAKFPDGDLLVTLKSQLIHAVPYGFAPYPHGFIHRPEDRSDKRYLMMKEFILKGTLTDTREDVENITL